MKELVIIGYRFLVYGLGCIKLNAGGKCSHQYFTQFLGLASIFS